MSIFNRNLKHFSSTSIQNSKTATIYEHLFRSNNLFSKWNLNA